MPMTPDAKRALAQTIRALRERLLRDLHDETERIYRLSHQQLKTAGLRILSRVVASFSSFPFRCAHHPSAPPRLRLCRYLRVFLHAL